MKNEFMLHTLNQFQGYKTRIKELHWSSPSLEIHKLTDEFDKTLREYEDEVAEYAISLWGEITPGELEPIPCKDDDFLDLLQTIFGKAIEIKREANKSLMWAGIESSTDTFITEISKYITQARMAYKVIG